MSIRQWLGYPPEDLYGNDYQEPVVSLARQTEVDAILSQLGALDAAIAGGVLDSMAVKIDKISVDYGRHLGLLKTEGSRLLARLGNLVDLEVYWDKYSQKDQRESAKTSPWSVKSYW